MSENKKHLYNLNELSDYKISDGYPDVRGWDVKDIDNRIIGKVDNLLVNKEAQRVVYLDVDVDKSIIDAKHDPYGNNANSEIREFVNNDGDNHIIIPIGLVDLNTDSNYVYTDVLDHKTFSETQRYRKGDNVNRAYEVKVLDTYERKIHHKNEPTSKMPLESTPIYHKMDNEDRIREIVREEIERYHKNNPEYSNNSREDDLDLQERRRNDSIDDDDQFYERREFDNDRFNKRTPGL